MSSSTTSSAATILIADDYDDNRELLSVVLTTAKYKVIEARNGNECLALARAHAPDLVMVDLSMPGLDGLEVCQKLKADPATTLIPCIAVTARDTQRPQALEQGFTEYVSKPFRTSDLLSVVKKVLSAHSKSLSN